MQIFKWGKVLAVAAALTMFAVPASAQDDDDGPITQGEDAKYVTITHVKFKPGKRERAMEIIAEHFVKASEAAGVPGPLGVIHYQSGEWDMLTIWLMEGGMADLEWYRSERDIKWFAALAEQEGGEEAAGALSAEYQGLIDESESDVGHFHLTGEDDE
jgi:hypothetical protein